jgi:hypothetical protein
VAVVIVIVSPVLKADNAPAAVTFAAFKSVALIFTLAADAISPRQNIITNTTPATASFTRMEHSIFNSPFPLILRYRIILIYVAEKQSLRFFYTFFYTAHKEVWRLEANKKNSTERVRLHRQKMKKDGFKSLYISITPEHKLILQRLCKTMNVSQACLISYLLDCAVEKILPNIDEPFGG